MCNIQKERCRTCVHSSGLDLPKNHDLASCKAGHLKNPWDTVLHTCCTKHSDSWILPMLGDKCHSLKSDDSAVTKQ